MGGSQAITLTPAMPDFAPKTAPIPLIRQGAKVGSCVGEASPRNLACATKMDDSSPSPTHQHSVPIRARTFQYNLRLKNSHPDRVEKAPKAPWARIRLSDGQHMHIAIL